MKRDQEFHDLVVHDSMGHVPGISSRAMFGGWGIYKDGVIFAIITDGALYFKASGANRDRFISRGMEPFRYESRGRTVVMSYWELPEEILYDKDALPEWITASLRAHHEKKVGIKIERGRKSAPD